jgi:hypothetical protein
MLDCTWRNKKLVANAIVDWGEGVHCNSTQELKAMNHIVGWQQTSRKNMIRKYETKIMNKLTKEKKFKWLKKKCHEKKQWKKIETTIKVVHGWICDSQLEIYNICFLKLQPQQ